MTINNPNLVTLEEVATLQATLDRINRIPLKDLVVTKAGKVVTVNKRFIELDKISHTNMWLLRHLIGDTTGIVKNED